jgi:hypothetical protein
MMVLSAAEQVPIPPVSLRRLLDTIVMPVVLWNSAKHLTKREIAFTLASGNAEVPDNERTIRVDRSRDSLPRARTGS